MRTSKPVLASAALGLVLVASPSVPASAAPPRPATRPAVPGAARSRSRPARLRLVLEGAFLAGTPRLSDSRSYEEYAETATFTTTVDVKTGFAPSAVAQLRLFRQLALLVGGSIATRGTDGRLQGQRPHPLYLSQPRAVDAELRGYDYEERALDLDLALTRAAGGVDLTLFGGATLLRVRADMLTRPTYRESYPYDELAVVSTPSRRVSDSPVGWNAGLRLDVRLGRHFGVGTTLRYSQARVELVAAPEATKAAFDAGGFSAGAGLRLLL